MGLEEAQKWPTQKEPLWEENVSLEGRSSIPWGHQLLGGGGAEGTQSLGRNPLLVLLCSFSPVS